MAGSLSLALSLSLLFIVFIAVPRRANRSQGRERDKMRITRVEIATAVCFYLSGMFVECERGYDVELQLIAITCWRSYRRHGDVMRVVFIVTIIYYRINKRARIRAQCERVNSSSRTRIDPRGKRVR